MKRRTTSTLLSFLLIAAMLLTACGADTPATTQAGGDATTAAGQSTDNSGADYSDRVLNVCYSGIAETMDPFEAANSIPHSATFEQVYVSLMRRDDDHSITYSLADKYEASADGKEYTFHIRSDATFANGEKITAEDVKFSYDKARTSTTRSPYLTSIVEVEAVDEETVKFTLDYADPLFLGRCAAPGTCSVVSKKKYEELGSQYGSSPENTLSSGPYVISNWEYNVSISFEQREDFWLPQSNIKKAKFFSITDTNGTMVAMQTGDIDLSWSPVTGSSYDTLKAADNVHFCEYRGGRYENVHMYYKSGMFADVRMRQAVAYAVKKDEALAVGIDNLGFTTRYPGDNPDTLANPDYDSPYMISYDLEKAKALVEECGNVGAKVTIKSYQPDPYPALSTWLQSSLIAIGLDAEIEIMERGAFLDACRAEEVEICILSLVGSSYDMDDDFCNYVDSRNAGSGNRGWYMSDEMDGLIMKARSCGNLEERTEYFRQMIDLMWKDVPLVPLFCWNYALPVSNRLSVPNGRVYSFRSYSWVE